VMTIVIGADGFSGFSIVGFAFDYLFHNYCWLFNATPAP
jgi:hypothetical protein